MKRCRLPPFNGSDRAVQRIEHEAADSDEVAQRLNEPAPRESVARLCI